MSLGAMGGGLASSISKTFAKASILVGGAVFVVRYMLAGRCTPRYPTNLLSNR